MKSIRGWIRLLGFFVFGIVGFVPSAQGVAIDFNNIPDGTPVSAANPYAGLVNLQGSARVEDQNWNQVGPPPPGWHFTLVGSSEATIEAGEILVMPPNPIYVSGYRYVTEFRAEFLVPVTGVSFKVDSPYWAVYSFKAVDPQGNVYNSPGMKTPPGYMLGNGTSGGGVGGLKLITIDLPSGYLMTEIILGTADPKSPDNVSLNIDDLNFTVPVPDPGSTATLFVLALCALVLSRPMARWSSDSQQ